MRWVNILGYTIFKLLHKISSRLATSHGLKAKNKDKKVLQP